MKCNALIKIRHQQGAALLAFILVMIVGSSFLMLSKINAKVQDRENLVQTYDSLQRAKDAIIGFALTTPERSIANPRPGPGHLPCPDIDNDGAGDAGGCNAGNFGANVRIGRIPYQTLEDDVLTGGNGDVLWYAIDVNYGFFAGPGLPIINSETPGQLTVDNQGDIVAVIIDPGPAIGGQVRDLVNPANVVNFNPVNFLENENVDLDINFISTLLGGNNANFNDNIIAITRQDLMAAVEKRVLSEVANAFETYRVDPDFDDVGGVDPGCGVANCDDAFPWLAPFADPRVNPGIDWFAGDPNPLIRQGLIGVHIPGQTYANTNTFTLDWSGLPLPAVPPTTTGASPPTIDCLRNAACTNQYGDVRNVFAPLNNVQCNWIDRYSFDCTGVDDFTSAGITRTIRIVYTDDGTGVIGINPPAPGLVRARELIINGNLGNNINVNGNPSGSLRIFISDTGANVGSIDHTYPAATAITTLDIDGVDYHLDSVGIDLDNDGSYFSPGEIAPEIPPWVVNNNWHHQLYVIYPQAAFEPLPGGNVACAPPNCINLFTNGLAPTNNIRGLLMIAGQIATVPGPPQNRGTGAATINDYYETVENTDVDQVFDRLPLSIQNTDQFRIINP